MLLQSAPPLAHPLTPWYSELNVALSVLHKLEDDPAVAADWLVSVSCALLSDQRDLCTLTLIVSHLIMVGQEDVCQLALRASQAIAAANPCQVHHDQGTAAHIRLFSALLSSYE